MDGQLARYAKGQVKVPRQDRAMAYEAKLIYDEVRLASLKADGSNALAGHIMEGLTSLDFHRRHLAGDDPGLQLILSEVMATAIFQVGAIQRNLYNGWGL